MIFRGYNLHCLDAKISVQRKHFHPHSRHARQLVATVDYGHGHKLPSDTPVPQELQRAFWWGCLNGQLLSQHFVHLLFVVTLTPQALESWDEKKNIKKMTNMLLGQ